MPLTSSTVTISDTLDESRNRVQHGLHMETVKETVEVNMLTETMDQEIDSSDESKSRFNVKSLEADGTSMKTVVAGLQIQTDGDSNDASQNRKLRSTTSDLSENSTSREDSCSMSTLQKVHQPVTPVQELKHIEPTRVNTYDIDECLVTNKSNSKQMSNQWLSNTFSRIASGILGKSKVETTNREVTTENVDTTSKLQLVFKPEFDFTL